MASSDMSILSSFLSELYDQYRTAMLNRIYYGARLANFKRWNLAHEIAIAIGTSSALAAWAIWQTDTGVKVWAIITGLAAILSILKPILQISKQIERYSKLFAGHGDVLFDLEALIIKVRNTKEITKEIENIFKQSLSRIKTLAPQDDPKPIRKLLNQCYAEVNKQVPADSLWIPKEVEK